MRIFKLYVLLLSSVLTLTGCFRPQGKSTSELERLEEQNVGNASWIASEVSGKSQVAKVDESFKVPTSKLYSFSVCVQDRRTQDPLLTQKFAVETATGEKTIRPDTRGCLNWSDEISFNFLADAKILKLERKVTANGGGHSGSRTFTFAINPWKTEDEVLDLSKVEVPEAQTISGDEVRTLLTSSQTKKPLALEGVKLHITKVTGGGTLMRLEIAPKVWLTNEKSERVLYPFSDGKFKLKYSLQAVGSEGVDRADLSGEIVRDNLAMRDRLLIVDDELKLKMQPTTGTVELVMSLEPRKGPAGLTAFEGKFLLGNADSLRGSHSFTLDPVGAGDNKTQTAALAPTSGGKAPKSGDLQVQSASAFDVSALSGFVQGYENESSTTRTLRYTLKACFVDTNDSDRKMRDMPVKVFKGAAELSCVNSKGANKCVSDQEGCVSWEEKLTHGYYARERYIKTEYTFKSGAGETKRTAVINPWEPESIFFFAQDLKNLGDQTVETVNGRSANDSKLFMASYSYNRVRTRYSVDVFLTLETKRAIQLTLTPRIIRDTIRRGRNVSEPLRPGYYLLKAAIVRDYKDGGVPTQFVSPVSRLVQVTDGTIVTTLEFSTRDLSVFALRSQLVLELSPVDQAKLKAAQSKTLLSPAALDALIDRKSDLKTRSFLGPIILEEKVGGSSLRPTDDLSETYCKTIDCDAFKASEQDSILENDVNRAKFYGSLRHMANISVTKLIPVYERNERTYAQNTTAQSHLKNLISYHNAEFIPLNSGPAFLKAAPELARVNKMYSLANDPSAAFLKHLNSPLPDKWSFGMPYPRQPMDRMSLGHIIHGHALPVNVAVRLCAYWMRILRVSGNLPYVTEKCYKGAINQRSGINKLADTQVETPFLIEPKLRVQKMTEPVVELGQKSSMHVGAHVSMGRSESISRTNSVSLTPTSLLQMVPSKVFGAIAGMFNWTLSLDKSKSNDASQGTDLEAGTSLYIERAAVRMNVTAYDRCVFVRMHPAFINQFNIANLMAVKPEDKARLLTRGILLCKGMVERVPIPVEESYYFISGAKGEDRLLDLDEAQNQPWSIGLRGQTDYNRFLSLIQAKPENLDNISRDSNVSDAGFERLRDAYKFAIPSFPAVLSIDATDSAQRR